MGGVLEFAPQGSEVTRRLYVSGDTLVPWDNVGVQYGLQALVEGVITPEEFLDLNAQVGSWKPTRDLVPEGFPFVGPMSPQTFDPWSSRNMHLSPDGATPAARATGDVQAIRALRVRYAVPRRH